MLLTRKATTSVSPQGRLARGLSGVLAKTMDRRTFIGTMGAASTGNATDSATSAMSRPWSSVPHRAARSPT